MLIKNKFIISLIQISLLILFTGCAAVVGHKGSLNDFDQKLKSNSCDFNFIDEKINDDDDTILWGIQGASLARNCNDYNKSIALLDIVESKFKKDVDKDSTFNNIVESTGSVLVNNNILSYEGNIYEKIMINTYKALNYASLKDKEHARIEFNRALDRQRRAKSYYAKEIKDKQAEMKKNADSEMKNAEKKSVSNSSTEKNKNKQKIPSLPNPMKIAKNKQTQDVIFNQYNSQFEGLKAYPDFVNPFTTYISGIYFMLEGDSRKATDLLKQTLRMDPKNKQIASDLKLVKSLKKSKKKYAWLIYENGESIAKDEIRIDIPLFIVTKKANYTGIALPRLKERNSSYDHLKINGLKTTKVCDMDNVIKTEFKKRLPIIVTEAVLNTTVKTVTQYILQERVGWIGGLTAAVYQGLTNKADVRSWTALPKNFQSLRVEINNLPLIIRDDKGNIIKQIEIPKNKNALIYVKSENVGNNHFHQILF